MKTNKIDVLDHGFVRLVSYMQPVPHYVDESFMNADLVERDSGWTGDLEIVRNARVSYDADWRTGEDEGADTRIINFMMEHGHNTPFEAMVFTFEIKCPIFIRSQWHRHRTWSYNEISARYSELPEEYYIPSYQVMTTQDRKNKQSRTEVQIQNVGWHQGNMVAHMRQSFQLYHELLEAGLARELARSVLPMATYTRYFGTVDLHNLFHFIRERVNPGAQWEMRQYAHALLELISPIVPIAVDAFRKTLHKPTGA